MFNCASSFDERNDWPVDNVTNMCAFASSFNQPIGGCVPTTWTSFQGMFDGAKSFNQLVGDWRVARPQI